MLAGRRRSGARDPRARTRPWPSPRPTRSGPTPRTGGFALSRGLQARGASARSCATARRCSSLLSRHARAGAACRADCPEDRAAVDGVPGAGRGRRRAGSRSPAAGATGIRSACSTCWTRSEGDFGEEDEAILTQLAQMSAIAIENTVERRGARIQPPQGRVPDDPVPRAPDAALGDPRLDAHRCGRAG